MAAVIPKISKLSPRVIRILGCNPGPLTLQGTNTYLIGTGKRRVLLDTGDDGVTEYIDNLQNVLQEHNVELEQVIVTHWHHDHVGGVGPIFGSIKPNNCLLRKFPRPEKPDTTFDRIDYNWLKDGEKIKVEGATLKFIHTPGHTTDHLVAHLEEEKAVFSGDCILGEGTAVFEDLHDYMISLDTILKLKPDVVYPGHGPVLQDPIPQIEYYISHRLQREKQILEVLSANPKKSFTSLEIVKQVYKETPESLHAVAALNVSHHLQKLQKEQKVIGTGSTEGTTKDKWCINKL